MRKTKEDIFGEEVGKRERETFILHVKCVCVHVCMCASPVGGRRQQGNLSDGSVRGVIDGSDNGSITGLSLDAGGPTGDYDNHAVWVDNPLVKVVPWQGALKH